MAHYYTIKNGMAVRYLPIKKDGTPYQRITKKMAAADGAVAGTTDTLKVLGDSGGLLTWKGNLGIKAGMESGGNIDKAKRLLEEYSTEAAGRGTEIHDMIETYLSKGLLPDDAEGLTACLAVNQWLQEQEVTEFKCEHCFVWKGWISVVTGEYGDYYDKDEYGSRDFIRIETGGTSDFVSDALIVDWKTVEDKGYGIRQVYAKEAAQCAMYRLGFDKPNARCVNVYIDRGTGKIVRVKEWTEDEMRAGLRLFALASLYTELANVLEA